MKKNYYGNRSNNTRSNAPRHASRRETLANAGINSDQYLSMRIDKEFIPDGAEIVIQVRDKETGEVRYVPFNQAMDDCFGKNSQFYKQEMSDGHIFNPYIHRRWLPAQFRRNIREAGYNGMVQEVRSTNPFTTVYIADYDLDSPEENAATEDAEERGMWPDMSVVY